MAHYTSDASEPIQTAPYSASYSVTNAAPGTLYMGVDLSDTTNFKHKDTTAIVIKKFSVSAIPTAGDAWVIYAGVVVENDASDGTAHWFAFPLVNYDADAGGTQINYERTWEGGLRLDVNTTTSKPKFFLSSATLANSALLQNDVTRAGPAGNSLVAVGDIVVYIGRVAGAAGNLVMLGFSVDYDTVGANE